MKQQRGSVVANGEREKTWLFFLAGLWSKRAGTGKRDRSHGFLRDIYQMPGIAETVNFDHIRTHYFRSHKTINPTGIISIGPWQDLDEPHGRDVRFG